MGLTEHNKYEQLIENELHFNSYTKNERGIFILKKESCHISDFETENIITGDLTKITFKFHDEKYIIMALYDSRNDRLFFFF